MISDATSDDTRRADCQHRRLKAFVNTSVHRPRGVFHATAGRTTGRPWPPLQGSGRSERMPVEPLSFPPYGPVTFTTALLATPEPAGSVHVTVMTLFGPLSIGGTLVKVHAISPVWEDTSI